MWWRDRQTTPGGSEGEGVGVLPGEGDVWAVVQGGGVLPAADALWGLRANIAAIIWTGLRTTAVTWRDRQTTPGVWVVWQRGFVRGRGPIAQQDVQLLSGGLACLQWEDRAADAAGPEALNMPSVVCTQYSLGLHAVCLLVEACSAVLCCAVYMARYDAVMSGHLMGC